MFGGGVECKTLCADENKSHAQRIEFGLVNGIFERINKKIFQMLFFAGLRFLTMFFDTILDGV